MASGLGAKAMKVAGAFCANLPSSECPQGFARNAMTRSRDRPILTLDDHRPAGCAQIARGACHAVLAIEYRHDAVSPLAQRLHIAEFLLKDPSLLFAKIQPHPRRGEF
jgi:hypothetical protein